MSRRVSHRFRIIAGVLAVAAYALPSTVGVISGLGHAASHLAVEAAEQRRIAASLGLTHSAQTTDEPAERFVVVETAGHVHTHGGSTHAHGGMIGDLLTAAESSDSQMTAAPSTPTTLGMHIPAPGAPTFVSDVSSDVLWTPGLVAPKPQDRSPSPRPPRA